MTTRRSITKKQKMLLDFIDGFIKGNGYSPTYREIMRALDYRSVSTVAKHIDNLVASGWLVKHEGEARSLLPINQQSAEAVDHPWWRQLEQEIMRRRHSNDPAILQQVEVLQQALAIIKQDAFDRER